MASHDLEDIVAVIDGRDEIVQDVVQANHAIRTYLANELGELLDNEDFEEALSGHLPGDTASQQRAPIVLERMRRIAGR